jgi:hypothetical protein
MSRRLRPLHEVNKISVDIIVLSYLLKITGVIFWMAQAKGSHMSQDPFHPKTPAGDRK